ncbi:MAG: hypothetical protein QMC73_01805 [Myxococcota bacterium]|jgi:hypothetical protein
MQIESPEGRLGQPMTRLSPSPNALAGMRLLALDNGKPGADFLLRRAGERLAERTGAVFVGLHRKKTAATPCEEELLDQIIQDADIVLTGTAD